MRERILDDFSFRYHSNINTSPGELDKANTGDPDQFPGLNTGRKEMNMNHLAELIEYVKNLPEGKIAEENEKQVIQLLFECWDELDGSGDTSMDIMKLHRYENLTFIPPATIEFEIERHGASVLGSGYAHVYLWTINLKEGSANCGYPKQRFTGKRDKPLKVKPLAENIAQQIVNLNKNHEMLDWKSDRKVKVRIAKVIPETNMQTTTARRKRFRNELEELLRPHGWHTSYYNVYEKSN